MNKKESRGREGRISRPSLWNSKLKNRIPSLHLEQSSQEVLHQRLRASGVTGRWKLRKVLRHLRKVPVVSTCRLQADSGWAMRKQPFSFLKGCGVETDRSYVLVKKPCMALSGLICGHSVRLYPVGVPVFSCREMSSRTRAAPYTAFPRDHIFTPAQQKPACSVHQPYLHTDVVALTPNADVGLKGAFSDCRLSWFQCSNTQNFSPKSGKFCQQFHFYGMRSSRLKLIVHQISTNLIPLKVEQNFCFSFQLAIHVKILLEQSCAPEVYN